MAEANSPLVADVVDSTAILQFNRPAERNPLSTALLFQLTETLEPLFQRKDLDSIIFTGAEDVFASGADITELTQLNSQAAEAFSKRGQELFQRIAQARQLTIAAINGYCMGGALDLALACDIRVASPSAVLAHPGARLGIITGWGGTQRLPRLVGRMHALDFFLTARRLTAHEALRIGLVSRVCAPLMECTFAIARSNTK